MKTLWFVCLTCVAVGLTGAGEWNQFCGPAMGHADSNPPVSWSTDKNVLWRTAVPGRGWSSPVVLDEMVWMTTALDSGRSLRAVAMRLSDGKITHDIEVFAPETPDHTNKGNSHATPTPVAANGRVYVSFGNMGNACIDAASGKIVWKNRLLRLDHKEGAASSPILWRDLFLLDCDGTDEQYVAALNITSGKLVWKTPRSFDMPSIRFDLRKAYCTPLVVEIGGKDRLISVGARRFGCYDPESGRELWYCDHPGYNNAPRPVVAGGLLLICTGWNRARLYAVRLDPAASGDVTRSHVVWKSEANVPRRASPLVADDAIYMVDDNGVVSCLDLKTGVRLWRKKLLGKVSASPVCAGGRIYMFDERGMCVVLEPDRFGPKILATNRIEGGCMASPAAHGDSLIVRSRTHLHRIGVGK